MLFKIVVCIFAGLGAGVATGFAGLSAATFISPMLIAFLNVPAYEAIGISLASDVLASAISAYTYKTNKNIDIYNGKTLMISVISFTIIGSIIAYFLTTTETGNTVMSGWMILASFLLGIKFWFFPSNKKEGAKEYKYLSAGSVSILAGAYIGFVCGFQGTGGGMMMLFTLTALLGFEFKKAVGTSVFIMTFTACIGAATHFWVNGLPDLLLLSICVIFTLIGAQISAKVANHMENLVLKKSTGALLTIASIIMIAFRLFSKIN